MEQADSISDSDCCLCVIKGGKAQNVSVPPIEGVAGGGTSYGWVDGGLRGSNLGTSVIDPTKVHSKDLLHVWSMPSTANVNQNEAPRPLEKIRFRRGLPPGDGVLFYPGGVFSSSHEPVASARLEHILSGMQDIEYLKLYSSKYGREEGLALLEKTGVYLAPDRHTLDHGPVDVMRGEVYRTCREYSSLFSSFGTAISVGVVHGRVSSM